MSARITMLGLLALASACDRPCKLHTDITEGCGVELADGPLRLGDELEAMEKRHGEPAWVDLGSAGQRFDYADQGVAGMSSDGLTVASLLVYAPYAGATADGLALGTEELAAPQTLGAGTTSPWQDINWHHDIGIGFESQDGAVSRIHVIPTTGD